MEIKRIAHCIDHTLLKPNATIDQIKQLCREAKEYGFFSVCVNPCWVSLCSSELQGTGIKVCSVISFPLGANRAEIKLAEARQAIKDGANELDMVINVGYLLSRDFFSVMDEIRVIAKLAHSEGVLVKVIIETGLLNEQQKVNACKLAADAGADFVKTCTGFSGGQATVEDIRLMKAVVGDQAQVKASGGIKTYADALAMIEAGATRIGTSSGVKIVQEEAEALLRKNNK